MKYEDKLGLSWDKLSKDVLARQCLFSEVLGTKFQVGGPSLEIFFKFKNNIYKAYPKVSN